MPRKPLTFNIDRNPALPIASRSTTMSAPVDDRKQVGARISAKLYRELKARAAHQGVKVQELVEAAVAEFLAKQ